MLPSSSACASRKLNKQQQEIFSNFMYKEAMFINALSKSYFKSNSNALM
jgi:hypothetical protein